MSMQTLINLIGRLPEGALATAEAELAKLVPPAVKLSFGRRFKNDFEKLGHKLVSDVEPRKGETELDAISFLEGEETSIGGEEMLKRAIKQGVIGQYDAEDLVDYLNSEDGKQASLDLREKYYVTGTVYEKSRRRCVAYLFFDGDRWLVSLFWLAYGCGRYVRLLVPRKP